jgi:hypothetical protein
MGAEATVTKKRVLGKVSECLDATNAAIATVDDLRVAHNALAEKVVGNLAAVDTRLKVQGAWIEQVEQSSVHKQALPKVLDALETGWQEHLLAQHVALMKEIDRVSGRLARFESMSFWQRIWWVFRVRLPKRRTPVPAGFVPPWELP